ncbi:MAG: transcriptional regulator [Magnetococcales bacterium]|nr:transcriptional regulator [Magnetococcales bacterium]
MNDISVSTSSRAGGFMTPTSFDDAIRIAKALASSSMVPKAYQGNPSNVLVAMQLGMEIGLHPLQAMQNIYVINERPALFGDSMLAVVRNSGLMEFINEELVNGVATCTVKRRGEDPVKRTFSTDNAKRAGLLNKSGPWTQYPERMLQLRARAFALRDTFPDVLKGMYMVEVERDSEPINMGPVEVLKDDQPKTKTATFAAKVAKVAKPESIVQEATLAQEQDSQPDPVQNMQQDAQMEAPTLDDVLAAIAAASSRAELQAVGDMASALESDEDKHAARKAFKTRREEIDRADTNPF